ncbi:hypothetical protein LJC04_00605 [Ruminococcaceae bacterium OttesenSCG-928-O06]|nr:hypothetical protein [Ruminococcaceae bacterium OttesenSCG-928-O06]
MIYIALLPTIIMLGVFGLIAVTGESYSTTDISQYGIYEGHIPSEAEELRMHTSLSLFPKEITSQHKVDAFYYYCSTQSFDNIYQIYLSYTLQPKDFYAEVERFSQMDIDYKGVEGGSLQYDSIVFEYPAYVLRFEDEFSTFEYALIDESNYRIVCMYSYIKEIQAIPMESFYSPREVN